MTQSVSPSEASLCQTSRAEWPSRRTAWTASWSQLLAGNWRTEKFIRRWRMEDGRWQKTSDGERHPPSSIFYPCVSSRQLFDFEAVVLNHRIAQQLVRRVVQRLLRGGLV